MNLCDFFIEANKLLYWSAIYTVLLWIFEATPSWPRCKQWSTREKVSQQCLWKMQRNVQMFWFNTVHNEASTYHENPNSKVSINMKIQHFPPHSPPGHLNIWRLVCLIPCPRGQNCVEIPHPSAGFDGHFFKAKIRPCRTFFWAICLQKWTLYLLTLKLPWVTKTEFLSRRKVMRTRKSIN